MTAKDWIELLTAISGLIGAIVWPAVLLYLVMRFRASIGSFVSTLSEFSLKAGGVEATGKRRLKAAAALDAALTSRGLESGSDDSPPDVSFAVTTLDQALPDNRSYRKIDGSRVLWVDDQPDNNRFERQTLEALGISFSLSTSTEDALRLLGAASFDLVISDLGRPSDGLAGFTLLDRMRQLGNPTPFVIYAGLQAESRAAEARRRGAIGCTSSPTELVRLVTGALS